MSNHGEKARRALVAAAMVAGSAAIPAGAQRSGEARRAGATPALDRSVAPRPGPTPQLHVPRWTRTALSNGAQLIVIEKHDLPLVAVAIHFVGGAANEERRDRLGVAQLTAQMLSEGTATMTGEQLADAQQLLGTHIAAVVGTQSDESGALGFTALADKLEPALAIVADMLVHPALPADALERLRGRALVSLAQQKEEPGVIATRLFAKVVYGDAHPYGRVVDETTVRAITRDDVVAFHRAYYQPGRAVITVTGDVQPAAASAAVEKALAGWAAAGARPTFDYPPVPAPRATTIYLADKPGAAQSVFRIGRPGPPRHTPDFFAIQVMNTILGGLFQSRLNYNIREVKGYSYGVGSRFAFGRGPGAFWAGGDVVTAKTDSALIEFMKELKGVQGGIPFTADEIVQGKESLIQALPRHFSSVDEMGGSIGSLYVQDLPETYFQNYAANVNAVTAADLVRVARKYIDLDHLSIVIVGDRASIEGPLRRTGIAPVVVVDAAGAAVAP